MHMAGFGPTITEPQAGLSLFQFLFPVAAARLRELASQQPLPPELQALAAPPATASPGVGSGLAPRSAAPTPAPSPALLPPPPGPLALAPQTVASLAADPASLLIILLAQARPGEAVPLHERLPLVVPAGATETLTVNVPPQTVWYFNRPLQVRSTAYDSNLSYSLTLDNQAWVTDAPLLMADTVPDVVVPVAHTVVLTVTNSTATDVTVQLVLDGVSLLTVLANAVIAPWVAALGSLIERMGIALETP